MEDQREELEPIHGYCLECGSSFHADLEGPGAEYCSVACYQSATEEIE